MSSQAKAQSLKKLAGKQKRRLEAIYKKVRKKSYRLMMAPLRSMPGGPSERAILPLHNLHIEKELGRIIRQGRFEVSFNKKFRDVMTSCSERDESWITPQIMEVYEQLHQWGAAHSVEAWKDDELAGDAYGVALGSVFVGESMFYRVRNASKVALVHLAERLNLGGFKFMGCQYPSKHWMRFGAIQITCAEYKKRLGKALIEQTTFYPSPQQGSTDD